MLAFSMTHLEPNRMSLVCVCGGWGSVLLSRHCIGFMATTLHDPASRPSGWSQAHHYTPQGVRGEAWPVTALGWAAAPAEPHGVSSHRKEGFCSLKKGKGS